MIIMSASKIIMSTCPKKYVINKNGFKWVWTYSLSELGRYPLHYDIVSRLLKYCYRLENLTREFHLLKDAYLCSKELHLNAKKTQLGILP